MACLMSPLPSQQMKHANQILLVWKTDKNTP